MKSVLAALVAVTVACALGAPVERDVALKAADGFISRDSIGSAILGGRVIDEITKRGELWIVALQPSGHIILSASDYAAPIVAFSENDFTEPDPESPAYAILEAASENIRRLEADDGASRDTQWDSLLAPATKMKGLLGAASVDNPTIIIPPLLASHFNQNQPYNDFSPIYEASTNVYSYRGRCPSGCVATAAAAEAHYFRWPARIDKSISYNHTLTTTSGTSDFPIRFDGHNPIEWDKIDNEYIDSYEAFYTNYYPNGRYEWRSQWEYDLRGKVPESKRFHIARLLLWADVLARMSFSSGSSNASFDSVASGMSEWYKEGEWIDGPIENITNYLSRGLPCQASIAKYVSGNRYGHQVIFDGWAQSGTDKLVHINYGWGGDNDGYYNITKTFSDPDNAEYSLERIYVNHIPRAKPQWEPLPTVCDTSLELKWRFPDIHTNNLSGFKIHRYRTKANPNRATPTTFSDNFTSSTGSSSDASRIYIGSDDISFSEYGVTIPKFDGKYLCAESHQADTCYYTFPASFTFTAASVLTFKLQSFAAYGMKCEIQAKNIDQDGGEWETIYVPSLYTGWGSSGWGTERVYLGGRGGESVLLRIAVSYLSGYGIYSQGRILFDDFNLTQALVPSEYWTTTTKDLRRTQTSLGQGDDYTFTIEPIMSGGIAAAEVSEPLLVSIRGDKKIPLPGTETYSSKTLSFSTNDTSGVWAYAGTAVDSTTILDKSNCSISVNIWGSLTASSSLSFGWSANNYYGNGSDTLTVVFVATDGTTTNVWTETNGVNIDRQNVTIPLGGLAGKSGRLTISYRHSGSYYTGDQNGGWFYAPSVTNVLVPTVPVVEWNTEQLNYLGVPEISSVEAVEEGFYKECGTKATTFRVTCSPYVDNLEARPSHLVLVRDEDVCVTNLGNGEFNVTITPSGVNESNYRSRMILTLVATDKNGTKAYKDLSLRFEKVEPSGGEGTDVITINEGEESQPININFSWFKDAGLTNVSNIAASEMKSVLSLLAKEDSDGDGISNWQEYVCGTSPTNETDKIICDIKIVNGRPEVTAVNTNSVISGYKATIKARAKLDATSSWVDKSENPTGPFFKVVIEQE